MNSWEIIYEYCDTHPNCTNHTCQKTVVVRGVVTVPSINLFSSKNLTVARKLKLKANPWSIVFEKRISRFRTHRRQHVRTFTLPRFVSARYAIAPAKLIGLMLLALGLGGVLGPMIPTIRMESGYLISQAQGAIAQRLNSRPPLPKSAPVVFQPLVDGNGAPIAPVNEDFAIIIPKIGVNAPIIANIDPTKPAKYAEALKTGVAHAGTSFLPDGAGTVYLFSHSTNYDWFVRDLNAVFYLVKNLDSGDTIVLLYNRKRYTYQITGKQVVSPKNASYLFPSVGRRNLILQTCWPPGSTTERLLIFADLIEGGVTI